jgi:predicted anti-sigma-YlaC factor YlaD
VDHHLATCAACRGWEASLLRAVPSLRVGPAEPVPDLSGAILADAAAAEHHRRAATPTGPPRVALVLIAAIQLAWSLPGLLGEEHGASVHVAREQGAWELALAVGLLLVALRPERAQGLLPVVAVLATTLLVSTGVDVVNGHTTVLAESSHLLPVAGLAMLLLLHRWERTDAPRAAAAS